MSEENNFSRILRFFCRYNSLLCIFNSMSPLNVWKKQFLNSSSLSDSQTIKLLKIWFLEKYSFKKVSNVLFFKYKKRDFMWKKRSFNYNYIELLDKKSRNMKLSQFLLYITFQSKNNLLLVNNCKVLKK